MDIQRDRVKIEFYSTGIVITVKDKNWTKIGEFQTPCSILYNNRLVELHNNYIVDSNNPNHRYMNEEFKQLLPSLLENGEMLPKVNK